MYDREGKIVFFHDEIHAINYLYYYKLPVN